MENNTRTVYVTKYALTKGIIAVIAKETLSEDMVVDASNALAAYHGNEWHETKESAIARAEQMRQAKIVSLQKSLAKIEKLSF